MKVKRKKALILYGKWAHFLRNSKKFLDFDNIIIFSSSKYIVNKNDYEKHTVINVSFENQNYIRDNNYNKFLLDNLKKYINENDYDFFFLSFFPFESKLSNIKMLQADFCTSKKCESKKYFINIMKNANISKNHYVNCFDLSAKCLDFETISSFVGVPFVVQFDSCGGNGTCIINEQRDWENIDYRKIDKISEYICGNVYNFNVINLLVNNQINVFVELLVLNQ